MNGYKLDLATKTITITKAFEDAVATGKGEEYKLLTRLQKDFPGLTIIRKTHRRPTTYTSKSGVSRCHPTKNLTYERMESFMKVLPKSEEFLKVYHSLRSELGKVQTNEYALVRRWFEAQFPDYRKNPLFYLTADVEVITDISPFVVAAMAVAAAKKAKEAA